MRASVKKKRPNLKRQLAVTRSRLATTAALLRSIRVPLSSVGIDPDRFIQCWAVSGRPVTQALDASGRVWELHTVMDKASNTVTEQFWTPLGMTRRER